MGKRDFCNRLRDKAKLSELKQRFIAAEPESRSIPHPLSRKAKKSDREDSSSPGFMVPEYHSNGDCVSRPTQGRIATPFDLINRRKAQ